MLSKEVFRRYLNMARCPSSSSSSSPLSLVSFCPCLMLCCTCQSHPPPGLETGWTGSSQSKEIQNYLSPEIFSSHLGPVFRAQITQQRLLPFDLLHISLGLPLQSVLGLVKRLLQLSFTLAKWLHLSLAIWISSSIFWRPNPPPFPAWSPCPPGG